MSKANTSLLLSGLVLPGSGHIYLKRYFTGGALIITSLSSLTVVTIEAIKQTNIILEKIKQAGNIISLDEIMELSSQAASNANTPATSLAGTLIGVCWLIGMIDAYRCGKQADKSDNK